MCVLSATWVSPYQILRYWILKMNRKQSSGVALHLRWAAVTLNCSLTLPTLTTYQIDIVHIHCIQIINNTLLKQVPEYPFQHPLGTESKVFKYPEVQTLVTTLQRDRWQVFTKVVLSLSYSTISTFNCNTAHSILVICSVILHPQKIPHRTAFQWCKTVKIILHSSVPAMAYFTEPLGNGSFPNILASKWGLKMCLTES